MTGERPETMRAWVVDEPGPIESGPLSYQEKAVPAPAPGELLVRVSACGVQHTNNVSCGRGKATQISARGHTANENSGIRGQGIHADAIAEYGASGKRTARIHSDDANLPILPSIISRQAIDK